MNSGSKGVAGVAFSQRHGSVGSSGRDEDDEVVEKVQGEGAIPGWRPVNSALVTQQITSTRLILSASNQSVQSCTLDVCEFSVEVRCGPITSRCTSP